MARRRVRTNQTQAPMRAGQPIPLQPQQRLSRRERWLGTKPQDVAIPLHSPEGISALQALLTQGLQGIQNPLAGFEPIRQNALRNYRQEVLPTIKELFANMGSGGAGLNSSGFAGALDQSGQDLISKLAGMESQFGIQNRQGLLDMLQLGLTKQYDYGTLPGQPGNLEKFLLPAAKGASQFLNFIPGVGPLLAGLAQGGLGTASNALANRRGGAMPYNMQGLAGDIANPTAINDLRSWLQDRRARAQGAQQPMNFMGGY